MTPLVVYAVLTWVIVLFGERHRPSSSTWCVWLALSFAAMAIWGMVDGKLVAGALYAGLAGYLAYWAWKRRPPRQRRPSRVLGRVRVIGHRLAVVAE